MTRDVFNYEHCSWSIEPERRANTTDATDATDANEALCSRAHPQTMTHYETLGVDSDADASSIRDAYKRLALARHPDRARSGDARAFLELKRAYDCLADAATRKRYDAALSSRNARPLADEIDVEEMDVVTVLWGGGTGAAGARGGASEGVDVYSRECRCGDAYEIPVAELQTLRKTHDECVLECAGCSLRIGVRLAPVGADVNHASASVLSV